MEPGNGNVGERVFLLRTFLVQFRDLPSCSIDLFSETYVTTHFEMP